MSDSPERTPQRFSRARTICVVMALFANVFATGVPLLHALAHHHADPHHIAHADDHHAHGADDHDQRAIPSAPQVEGAHPDDHPASLHEACVVLPGGGLDPTGLATPREDRLVTAPAEVDPPVASSPSPQTRAPPCTTPARAPPLV